MEESSLFWMRELHVEENVCLLKTMENFPSRARALLPHHAGGAARALGQ